MSSCLLLQVTAPPFLEQRKVQAAFDTQIFRLLGIQLAILGSSGRALASRGLRIRDDMLVRDTKNSREYQAYLILGKRLCRRIM